ncbi:TorD/DmsD family molecular chaperone [Pseudaminobacter soli (ex Li et al. 2025)]|uniref:Molecular chaperone TorD n=1 Tax=Pseudaminobacter soli (ex Li et al. 2025) TaxID=1295366 RepID=A0A2P7SKT5_9HYPH|nr:molecular chaperone TorD family protein [Mesorhizobium soli]PSJ63094.1 molecular chaperone TorD [Mesorhizobium soli]
MRVAAAQFVSDPGWIVPPAGQGRNAGSDDEVDRARAQEYILLARLLLHPPDRELLERLAAIEGDGTQLGRAHSALAAAARESDPDDLERDHFRLFIGVGRSVLLPYASYYLTGFVNERPLARLRGDLRRLGIERAQGNAEPEDHGALLCEVMAGFALNTYGAVDATVQAAFFDRHLKPWLGRLFLDLERSAGCDFYRQVGRLGHLFIEIETEAFALPA